MGERLPCRARRRPLRRVPGSSTPLEAVRAPVRRDRRLPERDPVLRPLWRRPVRPSSASCTTCTRLSSIVLPLAAQPRRAFAGGQSDRRVYRGRQFVAVSPLTRAEMRRQLGLREPVHLVPNGIALMPLSRPPRFPQPTIAVVTRLTPHKQLHHLVQVARPGVPLAGPHVDIAGTGPARDSLLAKFTSSVWSRPRPCRTRVGAGQSDLLSRAWLTVPHRLLRAGGSPCWKPTRTARLRWLTTFPGWGCCARWPNRLAGASWQWLVNGADGRTGGTGAAAAAPVLRGPGPGVGSPVHLGRQRRQVRPRAVVGNQSQGAEQPAEAARYRPRDCRHVALPAIWTTWYGACGKGCG